MRGLKTLIVCMLLTLALPMPTALAHPLPHHPHTSTWQAPDNFTGDLVLEIGLDLGADNECLFYAGFTGRGAGPGLLAAYKFASGGWGTFSQGDLVHAHTELMDTRDFTASAGGAWGMQSWRWGSASGNETFTVAGFGLAPWFHNGDGRPPLVVEVSCANPFEVTSRAGSTQVVGFTIDSLDGGTGASADTILGPAVSSNAGDFVAGSFDTARVATDLFAYSSASVGQATLDHPDGQESYLFGGGYQEIGHTGPGGDYRLTVDRVSVSNLDVFWGIMAGFDHVDHFDEILA